MFLDSNKKLVAVLTTAKTTLNMPVTIDAVDLTTTTTTPLPFQTYTNGVTPVDILSAPAASTIRKVNGLSIYGRDTAAKIIRVYGIDSTPTTGLITAGAFVAGNDYQIVSVGTTDFTLIGASANTVGVIFTATGVGTGTGTAATAYQHVDLQLQIDDTLCYTDVQGWYTIDSQGNLKAVQAASAASMANAITNSPEKAIPITADKIGIVDSVTGALNWSSFGDALGYFQTGIDNPIINKDMEVCQNPTSAASAPDGTIVPDHWIYNKIGTQVHTVSQSTDVPTVAQAGRVINFSYATALTTANNAPGATDESVIVQKIEGWRFRSIAQRACKIQFWVKATLTGIYSISLRNDVPDQSCVIPFTINTTETWELKTLNMPATPAAGTWNYGSGGGLRVGLVLMIGSTRQTATTNTWISGYYHGTASNVNGVQTGATNFKFTSFDIFPAVGNIAPLRNHEDDIKLCTRIRRRFTGLAIGSKILSGFVDSATTAQFHFEGDMRVATAVNYAGTLNLIDGAANYPVTSMAINSSAEGVISWQVTCSGGGMTVGKYVSIRMGATTDYVEIYGEF